MKQNVLCRVSKNPILQQKIECQTAFNNINNDIVVS